MDYRKEVMKRKEMENMGDQKIILILSSLILVAVILVGAIMIKMLYNNNKQLRNENKQLQQELDYSFSESNTRYLEEADLKELSGQKFCTGKNKSKVFTAASVRIYEKMIGERFEKNEKTRIPI